MWKQCIALLTQSCFVHMQSVRDPIRYLPQCLLTFDPSQYVCDLLDTASYRADDFLPFAHSQEAVCNLLYGRNNPFDFLILPCIFPYSEVECT